MHLKLKTYFINFLFSLIPISFIAGNLILNLNILLFIILSLFFYYKEILKIDLHNIDKLILLIFIYILMIAFYNNIANYHAENSAKNWTIILKSILFLRFLILYFAIRYLIEKEIINFKSFFYVCFFATTFLCFDLIFQFYNGSNFFGIEGTPRRMSGIFGDELIAGTYLQRFSIFTFFLVPFFFKIKNKNLFYLFLIVYFSIIFFSLIIAGNRIPLLSFITICFLIIIFEKEFRKYLIFFLLLISIIFTTSYKLSEEIDDHYGTLYLKIIQIFTVTDPTSFKISKKLSKERYQGEIFSKKIPLTNVYVKDMYYGYKTWELNKYFGGGIKSFRINCPKTKLPNCGPHPHNYYLEILSALGTFGLFILVIIFTAIIYYSFVLKYFFRSNFKKEKIIIPFMFLFLSEIFPFKTTGSFFTTGNATFIFLLISVNVALLKKKI